MEPVELSELEHPPEESDKNLKDLQRMAVHTHVDFLNEAFVEVGLEGTLKHDDPAIMESILKHAGIISALDHIGKKRCESARYTM
jgi:hypothetical protein